MNKYFYVLVIQFVIFSVGCNNKPSSNMVINQVEDTALLQARNQLNEDTVPIQDKNQLNEDFYVFIDQFQSDSVFQKERIVFPLKNLIYNTESERFDETVIDSIDWGFMDFLKLPNSYLKSFLKSSVDEIIYNIQIEETGVSVNYIFKIYNQKWYLIEIKDEST